MRYWLRNMRDEKGLTQEEVALLSDISRSYYTQIEQGTKTPSVSTAKTIAKALKFNWVIFFEDNSSSREQNQAI